MKIYSATKFSIVIVPPKLSEKTKESKLLVRSFRHIYKVAGFGIATGISGLFSLSQLSKNSVSVDSMNENFYDESQKSLKSIPQDNIQESFSASSPVVESESRNIAEHDTQEPSSSVTTVQSEPQDLTQHSLDVAETVADSGVSESFDLFLPFVIATMIFGGFTIYYFIKSKKSF